MNLIELKTNKDIENLFTPLPIRIERQDGKIKRIIIGNSELPKLVIQKAGTYNEHIEVLAPETKNILESKTNFFGAELKRQFDDEQEMEKWESEIKETHPNVVFERTQTSIAV